MGVSRSQVTRHVDSFVCRWCNRTVHHERGRHQVHCYKCGMKSLCCPDCKEYHTDPEREDRRCAKCAAAVVATA